MRILFLSTLLLSCMAIMNLTSCSNNEADVTTEVPSQSTDSNQSKMLNQVSNFLKADIIYDGTGARSTVEIAQPNVGITQSRGAIYIELTEDTPMARSAIATAKTMDDVVAICDKYDAFLSLTKNEFTSDSIVISTEKASEALVPIVNSGVEMLHGYGFSDEEIDNMILENNATREDIAALYMVTTAIEDMMTKLDYTVFNPDEPVRPDDPRMSRVAHCLMEAVFIDLGTCVDGATWGAFRNLGKKAISKMFVKVASRFLGPVGLALAGAEFAFCMWG